MRQTTTLFALVVFGLLACSTTVTQPEADIEPTVPATAAIAFVSTRAGGDHIWVANADGSGAIRVTEGSAPTWSPDGRRIAFQRWSDAARAMGIYVVDLGSLEETRAAEGKQPSWSPNGRLLFMRHGSIYTVSADGSGVEERLHRSDLWDDYSVEVTDSNGWLLSSSNYSLSHPTPSRDGRSLAFSWMGEGQRCVGIVDARTFEPLELEALCFTSVRQVMSPPAWLGSAVTVILSDTPLCGPGEWSPWWTCEPSGASSVLHSYDLASANREVVYTTPSGLDASNLDWSPDGRRFVFDTHVEIEPIFKRRIFKGSLETGEVRQLIPEAARLSNRYYEDYDAAWSPVVP